MNTIHWSGSLIVGVAILYSPGYLLEIRSSHNIVYYSSYLLFNSYRELGLAIDFLIDNIYVRFGSSVFRQVIGIPMGTNSAPLLADLFLHTFEYDFMVKTMKQDITKAIQFSNTFRYIDDLFSINNLNFGNCISVIYPSQLELKVARYSFSRPIPSKFEHKLRRHKQSFGKVATTDVLDKDEKLL